MSDDPASETYVSVTQFDCEEVGIEALDVEIDPDADTEKGCNWSVTSTSRVRQSGPMLSR